MTRIDPGPYLDHARRCIGHHRPEDQARALEARARLPEAVAILVNLGATKVILFGSLLCGALQERSDIDLAVEGLPSDRHWQALSEVSDVLERYVDLVLLEEAPPSLVARIIRDGEVLQRQRGCRGPAAVETTEDQLAGAANCRRSPPTQLS